MRCGDGGLLRSTGVVLDDFSLLEFRRFSAPGASLTNSVEHPKFSRAFGEEPEDEEQPHVYAYPQCNERRSYKHCTSPFDGTVAAAGYRNNVECDVPEERKQRYHVDQL
jgi:hypothetical protein